MSPSNAKQDKQQAAEHAEGTPGKKHDYQTNMPVGEILRRAREHFGQSLTDVENAIRIRASQIDAIEKSQYDQLPGRVYAIGFVRSYSEYLGFDGDKMVALFKSQSVGGGRIKPELNFPAPASESRMPPIGLVIAGLALFIAFMIVWASEDVADPEAASAIPPVSAPAEITEAAPVPAADSAQAPSAPGTSIPLKAGEQPAAAIAAAEDIPSPEAPETADAAADEATAPAPDEAASEAPAAASAAADTSAEATAAPPQDGITLNVIDNSWVEIRDQSGKPIVSRMLKTGDQYFVPNRPDLTMSLGNAGGIEIIMDGKTLPPLGRKGEVRRSISLDTKSLKALASPR